MSASKRTAKLPRPPVTHNSSGIKRIADDPQPLLTKELQDQLRETGVKDEFIPQHEGQTTNQTRTCSHLETAGVDPQLVKQLEKCCGTGCPDETNCSAACWFGETFHHSNYLVQMWRIMKARQDLSLFTLCWIDPQDTCCKHELPTGLVR